MLLKVNVEAVGYYISCPENGTPVEQETARKNNQEYLIESASEHRSYIPEPEGAYK